MSKQYLKIWFDDIENARVFFDGKDKHLAEFMLNVYNCYAELPLCFTSKLVAKYFQTYRKQIEFIKKAKEFGKVGGLQSAENQKDNSKTLEGSIVGVVIDSLEPKDKSKKIKDKREIKETKKEIAFSNEIESCYNSLIEYFNTKPKDKKASDNWKDCIKQLNEKHQVKFSDLIYIVSKARSDEFWSKNFISLLKLIKKNKEDIYYIDYFIEKFGVNPINTTTNQLQSKTKIPPTNQLMKVNYPSYE